MQITYGNFSLPNQFLQAVSQIPHSSLLTGTHSSIRFGNLQYKTSKLTNLQSHLLLYICKV